MFKSLEIKITEQDFSGVVTIKKEDKIIYNKAFGYRDRANEIKNETTTAFGIASGTKIFTALGILKLVELDKLSLDTKVFEVIDKPFDYDPNVTIKQLLSHTSGLPDYYDEDLIEDFDNFSVAVAWCHLLKPSDYMPVMPDRQMKFSPGESFHYNNGAYVFLSMVIEKLTGDYHNWIQSEILTVNGLSGTGFYKFNDLPPNTANGYIGDKSSFKTNIYQLPIIGGGDGGIYSTSEDIMKLWQLILDKKILSENLTEILLFPHTKTTSDGYYGLGVWLNKDKDHYNPSIVGSDAGVSFYSDHYIKDKMTVNVISNTSDGAWEIGKAVSEVIKKI